MYSKLHRNEKRIDPSIVNSEQGKGAMETGQFVFAEVTLSLFCSHVRRKKLDGLVTQCASHSQHRILRNDY